VTNRQPQGRSTTQGDCRWHGRGQGFESPKLHPLFPSPAANRIVVISAICLVLVGRGGQIGGLAGLAVRFEDLIHRLRAASQYRAQFLAIHLFRCTGVRVADQMGDVLNRYPCARQQRDETVPQLSRCPLLRVEPSVFGYLAERTPNVGRVERSARCVVKTRSLSGHRAALRMRL
jgi:hypothetical protein